MAKSRLESMTFPDNSFYYLDLLQHRDLSSTIESELKVEHQSPQFIAIDKGVLMGSLSHNGISLENIKELFS